MSAPHSFNLARLRFKLRPFRLHWFPRLRSTNDHAAVLRERSALFAPAVILTGHQLAGRGRGPHRWWSSAGCLTVTFVLPADEAIEAHQVPLLAGLAVRGAAVKISGENSIQLKWPNDIVHHGRKLAGLLCERVRKVDLIGVGLNVNVDPAEAPADIRGRVASLRQIAGGTSFDMTDVLVAVATELRETMRRRSQHPFGVLLAEYDQHHALIGRRLSVLEPGCERAVSGKCEGLDEMGRLRIRTGDGSLRRITAGQVAVR
jgi:BirA family biotin operon repressor/biotin-[acetyl-CoA-carboxylase] ligase